MIDFLNNDISENELLEFDEELLRILLVDRTTNKNIIWGTDDYQEYGYGFNKTDTIDIEKITGIEYGRVIMSRSMKSREQQKSRTQEKAEVFTPSWLCNKQNNLADVSYFGKEGTFNEETEFGWHVNTDKVEFPQGKTWQDYVLNSVLEITCGEAPYLVSRYDTTTGERIAINERIGLFDRKLRVISENVVIGEEWLEWSIKAIKHIYGFELQGDSLLIARENVLLTFVDYYYQRFSQIPDKNLLREVAEIISWNLWQMDGLSMIVPYSFLDNEKTNESIFTNDDYFENEKGNESCVGFGESIIEYQKGKYCRIKDWDTGVIDTVLNLFHHRYGKYI